MYIAQAAAMFIHAIFGIVFWVAAVRIIFKNSINNFFQHVRNQPEGIANSSPLRFTKRQHFSHIMYKTCKNKPIRMPICTNCFHRFAIKCCNWSLSSISGSESSTKCIQEFHCIPYFQFLRLNLQNPLFFKHKIIGLIRMVKPVKFTHCISFRIIIIPEFFFFFEDLSVFRITRGTSSSHCSILSSRVNFFFVKTRRNTLIKKI